MLFSEARGRKVVSTTTASTVGFIGDYVIDPAVSKVIAFTLTKTAGAANTLRGADIVGFGADAVTVRGEELIVEPDAHVTELTGKPHTILRKQVLSTEGRRLGTLSDVDFDPANGDLTGLLLDGGALVVEGNRLLGVGSYAVIVKA